jgi:serine/threonine protein phosphatase 1
MNGRHIAIGDIHGHALALRGLLELIVPGSDDVIVTLGDVVNRGPDSRGVIETLLSLQEHCHLIPVLGNHEEMMLDSRHDRHAVDRWRYQGGTETLLSYGADLSLDDIPESHWEFLNACRSFHETECHIFVHANYCWYSALDQQPASLLRWTSLEESVPRPHLSGKTVILGHTPGPVRDRGYYHCIDTGCGFGGLLTAMDVLTGHCWQVNENGEQQDFNNQKD